MSKRVLFVVGINLFVGCIVVVGILRQPRRAAGDIPTLRKIVDASVGGLEHEDIEQSVREMLGKQDQFQWLEKVPQPVTGGLSQHDVEQTLSSRRVQKVLESLRNMGLVERTAECDKLFQTVLRAHTNGVWAAMRHKEDPSSPANTQSLQNSHYSLCAAMLAAAETGQRGLVAAQFATMDQLERDFDARVGDRGTLYGWGWLGLLRHFLVPDRLCQVNVLYVAASSLREDHGLARSRFEVACKQGGLWSYQLVTVPWNASTTVFNQTYPTVGPVDFSKGARTNTFYRWHAEPIPDWEEIQKEHVAALRKIVFE